MEISKRSVVRIHPAPALFVDEKSLNNEASVHAYNPKGREKEGHNHRGGARDFDLLSGKDCGSTPHTSKSIKKQGVAIFYLQTRKLYHSVNRLPNTAALAQLVEQLPCKHQVVSSTLTGGSKRDKMNIEELLWILIGINLVSFGYLAWRVGKHNVVVKNMVKEQPNLTNKQKRK